MDTDEYINEFLVDEDRSPTPGQRHGQINSLKTPFGANRYRGHLFGLRGDDQVQEGLRTSAEEAIADRNTTALTSRSESKASKGSLESKGLLRMEVDA